jgi:hypothetical protein
MAVLLVAVKDDAGDASRDVQELNHQSSTFLDTGTAARMIPGVGAGMAGR